jgi:uncharacterized iron-regulated membrane protein
MSLRPLFGFLHRWVGLLMAAFLILTGVTGAIISWDHELDDLLNPHLMHAKTTPSAVTPARDPLALAREAEARDPRIRVTFVPLTPEAGESVGLGVDGRIDPKTGKQFQVGYNQLFLDPVTGEEQGRREWGAVWPITSETFVSFLYVFHYSLHLPEMWGTDRWGIWLLGVIAILWTLDCFIGFYLTLPSRANAKKRVGKGKSFRERWAPAWKIKWPASGFRLNFDIHRAFGLWLWGLLLMLAFTAFSLNLYTEVFYPMMSKVSTVTPGPFDVRTFHGPDDPIEPKRDFATVIDQAKAEAAKRGWKAPAGSIFYSPGYGVYGVSFFDPGGDHGAAGVGPPVLYYDQDGKPAGDSEPWKGTAADIFVQAQFPLHSGRILGLPGRILVSAMGIVVAALSVTGVVIWARKRRGRVGRARKERSVRGPALQPAE